MSISGALSNALSGLTASSRASELVSSNVANAATEGYGRRELNLSARSVGGAGAGVQVDGVTRVVDETILSDRRLADAGLGYASTLADFYSELEEMVGTPGDPGSLSNRIAQFEAALIDAASRPDASVKLGAALGAATGLTGTLNDISDGLQTMRQTADREIAGQVAALNRALVDIDDMNEEIVRLGRRQGDMSALFDQRQKLVDEIAAIVPLREIPRDNGSIALYTQGGAPLLEVEPVQFGFVQANFVTADMTLASGAL